MKKLLPLLLISSTAFAGYPDEPAARPTGGSSAGINFSVCHYNGSPINYCGAKNANILHSFDKTKPTFMGQYIPILLKPSELTTSKISKDTRGFLLYDPVTKTAYTFPWTLQTQEATPNSPPYPVKVRYNDKRYDKNIIIFQGKMSSDDYSDQISSSISADVPFMFTDAKTFANVEAVR